MRNLSDKICRENLHTHILRSTTFFRKSRCLWYNVAKILYIRTGHRWQYNTARALYMLDK